MSDDATRLMHADADAAMRRGDLGGACRALDHGVATGAADFAAHLKLAAIRRRLGDERGALAAVDAAVDLQPFDVVALLLKGSLHEALSDEFNAAELYRAARFHASGEKNLPAPIVAQLDHADRFLAAHRARIEEKLGEDASRNLEHAARARRFRDYVLDRRPVFHQTPTHYRYPGLADIEFLDFAFPALRARLRAAFPAIRAELDAVIAVHGARQRPYVDFAPGQPIGPWGELNRSPDWNALHLIRYGEVDPVLAAACPRTMSALAGEYQPDIAGLSPNVMFSLLAPKTHIPPHTGVANFRCVLHMPLIVPNDCRFRVGADTRAWIEGEPWIFDDTIEHEAWNDSDQLRVVLIADLWRPELDEIDRTIVREFMAAHDTREPIGAL